MRRRPGTDGSQVRSNAPAGGMSAASSGAIATVLVADVIAQPGARCLFLCSFFLWSFATLLFFRARIGSKFHAVRRQRARNIQHAKRGARAAFWFRHFFTVDGAASENAA
jgi:hypothetical protein